MLVIDNTGKSIRKTILAHSSYHGVPRKSHGDDAASISSTSSTVIPPRVVKFAFRNFEAPGMEHCL